MEQWISIEEVLADIERVADDGRLRTFSLSFVRANDSTNGVRGSIRHIERASKHTKPGMKQQQRKPSAMGNNWRFKDHQALPIQCLTTNQFLTPKWTHILTYNEQKVKHWG